MLFGRGMNVPVQQITDRLFYTQRGQIMVSVIFGFAVAVMFQQTCKGAACVVLRAPPAEDIQGRVFRNGAKGDDCYTYVPRMVPCESGASKTDN